MKRFVVILLLTISMIMASSCSNGFEIADTDMHGKGIDECELSFVTDSDGNIDCRELISRYFTEDEIRILDRRVQSIKTVRWPEKNIFGQTDWIYHSEADAIGNYPYTCDIVLNEELFTNNYKNKCKYKYGNSDANLFMIQETLIHELCHVLWSDPYAEPADESVPSAVSRKYHNEEWYYGFRKKLVEFTTNNKMQKYRIKFALSKYNYEKFGSEYDYIINYRAAVVEESYECCDCELCENVIHID